MIEADMKKLCEMLLADNLIRKYFENKVKGE